MHVYKALDCVTIVGFGLSLSVADGEATVEYNGFSGEFDDAIRTGQLSGIVDGVTLDKEQRTWLKSNRTWVQDQIEDNQ